jgi:predicted small secreted protein
MFQYALYRYLQQKNINAFLDVNGYSSRPKHNHETYRLDYFDLPNLKKATFDESKDIMDFSYGYSISHLLNKRAYNVLLFAILKKAEKRIKNIFGINYKLKKTHYIETEKNRDFYKTGINSKTRIYMEGFFQSWEIIKPIKNILINDFEFHLPLPLNIQNILTNIQKCNSVSIHLRCGDYLTSKTLNICSPTYYENSVRYFYKIFRDAVFFIFCDDLNYVKSNIAFIENYYIIDTSNEMKSDYYDLFLMTKTKHNIIANSTFSWWGAFLNTNDEKIVIAPQQWFADNSLTTDEICPPEWIRIPN